MEREEAIRRIKARFDKWALDDEDMKAIQTLIPELAESEDERIIEKIIDSLNRAVDEKYITLADRGKCLAYLEKQKEQKPVERLPKEKVFDIMRNLTALSYSGRIPINSDEYGWIHKITEDVRSLLDYPIEQQSAEKQDYCGLNDLERAILRGFLAAGVENVPVTIIKETAKECLAQTKPVEWSEEDERILKGIIGKIDHDQTYGVSKAEMLSFLKSLRPQPHTVSTKDATKFGNLEYERGVKDGIQSEKSHQWKPNDEQMKALHAILGSESFTGEYVNRHLTQLYEQLKKLM